MDKKVLVWADKNDSVPYTTFGQTVGVLSRGKSQRATSGQQKNRVVRAHMKD